MGKLSCIIVDDEPLALALLKKYVEQTAFLELTASFDNALQVLNYFEQNQSVNLIFSDIQMPDLNGIQLSKLLPDKTKCIFTTAFDNYAIEDYKVNALDYLLKPFDYEEFFVAATKAKNYFDEQQKTETTSNNHIYIKSDYKHIKVMFDDILFVEGMKDYAKFYLKNQTKPLISLISLKKLEEELPEQLFIRIHRSYIVSLDQITSLDRASISIDTKQIPIGQPYRELFDKRIKKQSRFL